MKTYKEFIEDIQESSLSRIKSKSDKGGMAIISGSRGDKSSKENKARAKQLDKDIRGKGLPGATKVSGRWDEKDDVTGKTTKVKERSHVVTSGKIGQRIRVLLLRILDMMLTLQCHLLLLHKMLSLNLSRIQKQISREHLLSLLRSRN